MARGGICIQSGIGGGTIGSELELGYDGVMRSLPSYGYIIRLDSITECMISADDEVSRLSSVNVRPPSAKGFPGAYPESF